MAVPGCLGGEQEMSRTDFCVASPNTGPSVAPQAPPMLPTKAPTGAPKKLVSYGGTPPSNAFPLQQCEGDCDVDTDVSHHFLPSFLQCVLFGSRRFSISVLARTLPNTNIPFCFVV